MVDQLSVADGGMSHELVAATAALEERLLLAGAKEAVVSGLLVAEDDGYAFSHGLIRQVLYDHLLPGERRRLHRSLAEALAARAGVNQGSLAQHWHLAGCWTGQPPRPSPRRARPFGTRLPGGRPDYALAIDLESWLPQSGPELFEEAAQAASWAGDPERAAGWAAERWHSPVRRPGRRARLLERLGRYRWEAGDPRAAVDASEEAVALLPGGPPSALRARVLAALATHRMLLGESAEALPPPAGHRAGTAGGRGRRAGPRPGHPGHLPGAEGDPDAVLAALRASFGLARATGSLEDVVRAATNHMYLLIRAGRFTEALGVARGRAAGPPRPWRRRPR